MAGLWTGPWDDLKAPVLATLPGPRLRRENGSLARPDRALRAIQQNAWRKRWRGRTWRRGARVRVPSRGTMRQRGFGLQPKTVRRRSASVAKCRRGPGVVRWRLGLTGNQKVAYGVSRNQSVAYPSDG